MYAGKENAVITAVCPYFRSEYKRTLTCDGIGNADSTTTKFLTEEDKNIHIRAFCQKYPNTCELAKVLDEMEE